MLYRLDAPASAIAAALGADAGSDPWTGDYVAPGRPAPVVVGGARPGIRPALRPKLWGVPPPPRGTRPVTSVRNLQSPFWIGTLRHPELRCLVPATAFAVWSGRAGARRQHWVSLPGQPIFAFAGIHRQREDWPSFAILTSEPSGPLEREDVDGMPLILHPEDHARWLAADWREVSALVVPYPGHLLKMGPTPP